MKGRRGPHYCGKCPFDVVREKPLSAADSINNCVACVTNGGTLLGSHQADLRQLGLLTVIAETPRYDPNHASGASFTTFIKHQVCGRLWSYRKRETRYVPCDATDDTADPQDPVSSDGDNPLATALRESACAVEPFEDACIREMEVRDFRSRLPALFSGLTEKERAVIGLKYLSDVTQAEIATALGISRPRVSKLLKRALGKLRKAYFREANGS